jgi:hypothetical protein
MSVDTGWHLSGRLRLLFEVARSPGIDDVARLFESSSEPDTALAYGLSAALVADVRRRHGSGAPGAIAARVAAGADFAGAFLIETGESPDEAALHAWRAYRRWTTWIVAFSDGSAVWMGIVVVSAAAFVVVRRRRAERRRRWDEEEAEVNE